MPTSKSPRNLTAPDLVKRWRALVGENVMIGRDAHLLSEALRTLTPVQLLLGMYRFKRGNSAAATATIPIFLRQKENWLELDEVWAEIDLATYLTNQFPREYYTYLDYLEEESAYAFTQSQEAKQKLREWAEQVLI